jgi:ribosomal protein S18 acetylase RimI-like enzyme
VTTLLRDARPAEYADIARLLRDVYGGEDLVRPGYLPALEDTGARAEDPATDVVVAVDPDTAALLGTATVVLPGTLWTSATREGEASLRMLAVHPSARGRGVGAALVGECVARTRLAGITAIGLHTTDAMRGAHRLYARCGFTRAPERDEEARSGGMLRAFTLEIAPGPTVRVAQPEEYDDTGRLTVEAYVGDGLITATDSYVEELLDSKQRAAEAELLVAVDQATGTLLGTATFCLPGSPYGEVARPDEGEFRMLGVAKEARGRGVGEALVRTVLRRSHASGLSGVVLSTSTKMRTAHRLYERLGFGRDPERDWYPVPDVALLVYAREV